MKLHLRNYCLFLLLLAAPVDNFAQSGSPKFIFDHIQDPAKLPIINGWGLMKDRNGFLWIGGLEGLHRFDGFTTRVFKSNEKDPSSITDNGIARIVQDEGTNGLWVGTVHALNFFNSKRGIFEKYYPGSTPDTPTFVMPYCIDDKQQLWLFSGKKHGLYCFDTKTKQSTLICVSDEVMEFYPGTSRTKQLFAMVANNSGGLTKLEFSDYKVSKTQKFFSKGDSSHLPALAFSHNFWIANDSIAWLGADTGLVEFNFKRITYKIFNRLGAGKPMRNFREIAPIKNNYLLVGTAGQGLLVFNTETKQFVDQYLHDPSNPQSIASNSIGEIVPDSNGNIFLVTARKGIDIIHLADQFIARHLSIAESQALGVDNEVSALAKMDDTTVWIATSGSKIFLWNPKGNRFFRTELTDRTSETLHDARVNHLYYDGKKLFVSSTIGLFVVDQIKKTIERAQLHESASSNYSAVRFCTGLPDGRYVFTTNSSLYLLEMINEKPIAKTVTGFDSLQYVDNRQMFFDKPLNLLNILVSHGAFVVALKYEGDGIFKYKWRKEIDRIGYQFFKKPDGNYWILTNEGLIEMEPQSGNIIKNRVEGLINEPVYFVGSNESHGGRIVQKTSISYYNYETRKIGDVVFLSNQFSNQFYLHAANMELDNDQFALGSIQGVTTLKFSKSVFQHNIEHAYIRKVVINDAKEMLDFSDGDEDTVTMGPEDKTIRFDIGTVQYRRDFDGELEYKLNGYDKDWIKSINDGTIRYTNLTAGTYQFQLRESGKSSLSKIITLKVQQPFWKTNWFLALTLLSAVLFILWVAILRGKQIRKETQLKSDFENKMLHLEMQNLRSQMNPHFIFNSLNSINGFIIENETRLASDYLTKFSKLVRLILENSKNESINLEKELEALKLYLLMESLRFEGKFSYRITVEDAIDIQQTKVPPMIIQPYAENAIWHGFMQKQGRGNLSIDIKKTISGIQIEIVDDGIGREQAGKLKSKQSTNTKSYGMQITEQRIQQLNPKNSIETIDLSDNGKQSGTKIIVHLNF